MIKNKVVPTWQAQIFCGLRVGYTRKFLSIAKIHRTCRKYVNKVGWCVTVTPTQFVYKDGQEFGAIIGIINYPRFPKDEVELKNRTIELAKQLLVELKQFRVSIVFPDETIMLEGQN